MVGDVSSQFFSGLLLAAPQIGLSTITSTTPLQSSDYVTLTTETMRDFGVEVEHTLPDRNINEAFTVPFGASFIGRDNYQIEGDWSNAAIWMVAAGMTGKPITITGMNKTLYKLTAASCKL